MARHAQPREAAELKGADKKNPQRYKGEPLKSETPLGQPPEVMAEDAKAIWRELSMVIPDGILTGPDGRLFGMLCNLFAEYDRCPENFAVGKYGHVISLAARFGLSPSDRQKFISEKPKAENRFSDESLLN